MNYNKLLICEDDEDQAYYLQALLESAGYQADIAFTAMQAKKLLASQSYQALLLDLILPDQDGITFIRELRAVEKTRSLPIIVQSIIAQTGRTLLKGEAFSLIDWLDKPINFNKLLDAILLIKAKNLPHTSNILHVEDDKDTQDVLHAILEGHAEVTSVTTLKEAKEKLAHGRYHLIILDLLLPDGNGVELLPQLNKYNLPVIIYSAIELDQQYAAYVTEALVKSKTSNEELINAIKNCMELNS
ncbi:MAG: response regulator [Gammaproteobacteria bacterium]